MTLSNFPDLARCLGVDPNAVLARNTLQASALSDPENWLPGKVILDVIEDTAKTASRDDFGVLLGEFRSFASLGPVSLLLKQEPTLNDVLGSMIHYRRLINELLVLKLEQHGNEAVLLWGLSPGLQSSQGINLLATIAYRVLTHGLALSWEPESIHFRHAPPVNLAAFSRVFRCRLEFDSSFDGVAFHSGRLDSPNAYADLGLAAHARRLLDLVPGVRQSQSTSDRAGGAIGILLLEGHASSEKVARALGLSSRNLHRRLRAEGETFGHLLNSVRQELVTRQLRDSTKSITTIAEETGFSAVSSFTRWFTAQFGMPPRAWRRAQTQNGPGAHEWRSEAQVA